MSIWVGTGDGLRSTLEWVGEGIVALFERMNEAKAKAGDVQAGFKLCKR
jgi:hypothetical protein